MKRLRILLFLLLIPAASPAQTAAVPVQSCVNVATQAQVQGLSSTNYLTGAIPSCTVTLYLTGTTTLATYALLPNTTPTLTGPFTASSSGQWLAFVTQGVAVDVVLSGGVAPNTYSAPLTITDVTAGGGGGIPAGCTVSSGVLTCSNFDASALASTNTGVVIASQNLGSGYTTCGTSQSGGTCSTAPTLGSILSGGQCTTVVLAPGSCSVVPTVTQTGSGGSGSAVTLGLAGNSAQLNSSGLLQTLNQSGAGQDALATNPLISQPVLTNPVLAPGSGNDPLYVECSGSLAPVLGGNSSTSNNETVIASGCASSDNTVGIRPWFGPSSVWQGADAVAFGAGVNQNGSADGSTEQVNFFDLSAVGRNSISFNPSASSTYSLPEAAGLNWYLNNSGGAVSTKSFGVASGYASPVSCVISGGTLVSGSAATCTATVSGGELFGTASGSGLYSVPPLMTVTGNLSAGGTGSGYVLVPIQSSNTITGSEWFDTSGTLHVSSSTVGATGHDLATLTSAGALTVTSCTGCGGGGGGINLLTGTGAPSATCSSSVHTGWFYVNTLLYWYECSNATGTYQWNQQTAAAAGTVGTRSTYYATGNAQIVNDCTVTASSTTLSCASNHFASTDVGKTIAIPYAGTVNATYGVVGNTFTTTIAAYVSATQITLTAAPTTSVQGPQTYTNCAVSTGSLTLTCTGGSFAVGDIGKQFTVPGAGEGCYPIGSGSPACANGPLQEWIYAQSSTSVVSVTNYPLASVTGQTINVPGATVIWGTDDTTAVQNAVTAGCNGGPAVVIEPGRYLLSSNITPCSGEHIYGYGAGISILQPVGNGFGTINNSGSSTLTNIEIDHIEFDGTGVRDNNFVVSAKGIEIAPTVNSYVHHNYCHDTEGTCIAVDSGDQSYVEFNTVSHGGAQVGQLSNATIGSSCIGNGTAAAEMRQDISYNTVSYCGLRGIFIETQNTGLSSGIRMIGNSATWVGNQSADGCGICDHGGFGTVIEGNRSSYNLYGLEVTVGLQGSAQWPSDWNIQGNTVTNNKIGIQATWNNEAGAIKNNLVNGTLAGLAGDGIKVLTATTTGSVGPTVLDVSGNTVENVQGNGINVTAQSANSIPAVNIVGNTLYNNGVSTSSRNPGIFLYGTMGSVTLASNKATDSRASGSKTQSYGFQSQSGTITTLSDNNNDWSGNALGSFNFESSSVVTNYLHNGNASPGVNLVPDSEDGGGTWTLTNMSLVAGAGYGGNAGFQATGTGSAFGTVRAYSQAFTVTSGGTYTICAQVNGTYLTNTVATVQVGIATTSLSSFPVAIGSVPVGANYPVVCASGAIGAYTSVVAAVGASGGTVSNGNPITFSDVVVCPGSNPCAYSPTYVNGTALNIQGNGTTATPSAGNVNITGSNGNVVTVSGNAINIAAPTASGAELAFGNGFVEKCMLNSGSAITCLGDSTTNAVSTGSTSQIAASSSSPLMLQWTSGTTSGNAAGWYGLSVYYANKQPQIVFGTNYNTSTDYSSNARIQLGLLGNTCVATTMQAGDSPSCSYAMIEYSTSRSDSHYQCVTDNGSGSPTVTAIGTTSPSTTFQAMSISYTPTSVSCTVGSTTVSNTTTLPASTVIFLDMFYNTTLTNAATHLRMNGVYGTYTCGTSSCAY